MTELTDAIREHWTSVILWSLSGPILFYAMPYALSRKMPSVILGSAVFCGLSAILLCWMLASDKLDVLPSAAAFASLVACAIADVASRVFRRH